MDPCQETLLKIAVKPLQTAEWLLYLKDRLRNVIYNDCQIFQCDFWFHNS